MEFTLPDGSSVTEEELDRLGDACDNGNYPGSPGEWVVRSKDNPKVLETFDAIMESTDRKMEVSCLTEPSLQENVDFVSKARKESLGQE